MITQRGADRLSFDFSQFLVGVFDSGLGGRYVDLCIRQYLPNIRVLTLADQKNIPYGSKTPEDMLTCLKPFIKQFEEAGVDAIVLACNTCYLNLSADLSKMTEIPVLGYEPDLSSAVAHSKSQSVLVAATPASLNSRRWQVMKSQYPDCKITELDCRHWVSLIENSQMTREDLQSVVERAMAIGADGLVLGCTHYNWLSRHLKACVPKSYRLSFYEPTLTVLARLEDLLLKRLS